MTVEIANNYADCGGGISCEEGNAEIINCTIVNNIADYGGGVLSQIGGNAIITNSVVRDNFASFGGEQICVGKVSAEAFYEQNDSYDPYPAFAIIRYSNVQGGQSGIHIYPDPPGSSASWGSGNIDSDPKFVNFLNGDYRLSSSSPCRDTGYNVPVTGYNTDLDGSPRIINNVVDMGAYEYQGSSSTPSDVSLTSVAINVSRGMFTLKGNFDATDLINKDIYIRVGNYEQTITAGSGVITSRGRFYLCQGSFGKTLIAKFDNKNDTFSITAKGINLGEVSTTARLIIYHTVHNSLVC